MMKPYDPAAKCPKCGHAVVSTIFCGGHKERDYRVSPPPPHSEDALHRQCTRCGYGWLEDCVKAQEEK